MPALLLLFVFAACAVPVPAAAPLPEAASSDRPLLRLAEIERGTFDGVNDERRRGGLRTLALSDSLSVLARRHSEDMARRNYFSHDTPEGRDVNARARGMGLACHRIEGQREYRGYGENLFFSYDYAGYTERTIAHRSTRTYQWKTSAELMREAVEGWMNSPGHRANILNDSYVRTGMGVARAQDGRMYFTQVFC